MRRLLSLGLAASVLVLAAAHPAMAQDPDAFRRNSGTRNHAMGGGGHPNFGGGGGGAYHGVNPGAGGGRPFGGPNRWFNAGRQFGGDDRRHAGFGLAAGAGVAGLAAGALIGGAIANQQPGYGYGYDPGPPPVYDVPDDEYAEDVQPAPAPGDEVRYCESRYRSYDPASGTYLGFDGLRHACP